MGTCQGLGWCAAPISSFSNRNFASYSPLYSITKHLFPRKRNTFQCVPLCSFQYFIRDHYIAAFFLSPSSWEAVQVPLGSYKDVPWIISQILSHYFESVSFLVRISSSLSRCSKMLSFDYSSLVSKYQLTVFQALDKVSEHAEEGC